jgi:hypothetical protein
MIPLDHRALGGVREGKYRRGPLPPRTLTHIPLVVRVPLREARGHRPQAERGERPDSTWRALAFLRGQACAVLGFAAKDGSYSEAGEARGAKLGAVR